MSTHSDDSENIDLLSLPVNYSLDFEFLVAKELPDPERPYDLEQQDEPGPDGDPDQQDDADWDTDEESTTSSTETSWACPCHQTSPFTAILHKCKDVLIHKNEAVAIRRTLADGTTHVETYNPHRASDDASQSGYWILEAAEDVVARDGAPEEYEWYGTRLRSPMYREDVLKDGNSRPKWCIAALRRAIHMHVNSTCQLIVNTRPHQRPIDLAMAKKLATLVLMLEQPMLLPLCPTARDQKSERARLLTKHLENTVNTLRGVAHTTPKDEAAAALMRQHLPALHDKEFQERVQVIWGMETLADLARFLRDASSKPFAFGIDIPEDADEPPTASFRYALWHPYEQLDATTLWAKLSMHLMKVMDFDGTTYKALLKSIDDTIDRFRRGSVDETSQWQGLMAELGLTQRWIDAWAGIVAEYGPEGQLSPDIIDCLPALGQVEDLSLYWSN